MWLFRLVLVGVMIMARGAPDDSNVKVGKDLYRLDDLAELAVRLGSIVNYNRYGSVLMLDGFESGLNAWDTNTTGVGSEVGISGLVSYQGQVCCRVKTGINPNPYAGFHKYLPPVSEGRVGLQTCFSFGDTINTLLFQMTYGKADVRYHFIVVYDYVAQELQYCSAPGVYTPFATGVALFAASNIWHNFKMVVDLESKEHVRCSLDNVVYDMTGLAPTPAAGVVATFLSPVIRVSGVGLVDAYGYFDNLIVTYNEF